MLEKINVFKNDDFNGGDANINDYLEFGYFSSVNINNDVLSFRYQLKDKKDLNTIINKLIISELKNRVEYPINIKMNEGDYIMKINDSIYFYCADSSIPLVSIISFSYNINTGEINKEIKGCTLENVKTFDSISKAFEENTNSYNTGENTKADVSGMYIKVMNNSNNEIALYAIPLLKPNKIYALSREGNNADFMTLINGKILFGNGIIDEDVFRNKINKVFDIEKEEFLDSSKEDEVLLNQVDDGDFEDYRNDDYCYNNLMDVLKEGTGVISNKEGRYLVKDLVNEILNLYNYLAVYTNSFLQSQGSDGIINKAMINTAVKYNYIKKYLDEEMSENI